MKTTIIIMKDWCCTKHVEIISHNFNKLTDYDEI